MPRIIITDHYPYCEAAPGDTIHFEYSGQAFYAEYWATRHGSGIDIYDLTHRAAEPFADDREEFESQIRQFLAELGRAEEARGIPALRQVALAEAMDAFNE